jgi:predicted outer membrane protein
MAFAGFALAGSAVVATASNSHSTIAAVSDAEILGTYIQVNGFDVETALLGRSQASLNAVRELAVRVSSDHLGVRQAAFDLAAKCKVWPVTREQQKRRSQRTRSDNGDSADAQRR